MSFIYLFTKMIKALLWEINYKWLPHSVSPYTFMCNNCLGNKNNAKQNIAMTFYFHECSHTSLILYKVMYT